MHLIYINFTVRIPVVFRHLALEGLVLAAFGGGPGIARGPIGSGDDLGVAEQEQLVRGRSDGGILVCTADVVRELPDALHLGLEIGRHEVPDLAGVHLRTELGHLPTAGVGARGVHAGFNIHRNRLKGQTRLSGPVREIIAVTAIPWEL